MFAVLHSDINSLKSGLLHLTGQPYCKKSRSVKVKNGIINLFLETISLIDTLDSGVQEINELHIFGLPFNIEGATENAHL